MTFAYIEKNGVMTELLYPYRATAGRCKALTGFMNKYKLHSHLVLRNVTEHALMDLVTNVGPVTVVVNAKLPSFQSYAGGIYNDPDCTNEINHAMLLIVMDECYGFGINGTMLLTRRNGLCGILGYVAYPVLE